MQRLAICLQAAIEAGFERQAPLDPQKLQVLPEVRDMCAADRCQSYGRCWTCPPHCGEISEWGRRMNAYQSGVLVQTIGLLEDSFDFEGMTEAARIHGERFTAWLDNLRPLLSDILPLGAGACHLCKTCTCPDAPCRFPGRAVVSMEAAGLMVSTVCQDCGLPYHSGANTVTYSSCVLMNDF